ncbi:MAG: heavy metal translocating P-type ATPase [Polyangiaceae bacterium]
MTTDVRPFVGGASEAACPTEAVLCAHCGLVVPAGLIESEQEHQFCCHGCRTVYHVLHQNGLTAYYDYRRADGTSVGPALASGRSYAHFDEAKFHELYVRHEPDGTLNVRFLLEGVHCAACVWLVEKLPRLVPGVLESRLDLGKNLVALRWDPEQVALSAIAEAIDRLGYPPHPPQADQRAELDKKEDRKLLIRIAVAGACAGNVMLMAAALYGGLFQGMAAEYEALFRWGSFLLTLPAVLWAAALFYKGAFYALRARAPHMDLPITIGILTGFGWGAYNTLRGTGEIYFDSVTALIFLLLVGRWVQRRHQRRASRAAELLYAMAPASARLIEGATSEDGSLLAFGAASQHYRVREVPLEALELGALVEVRAGDRVPVDGLVVDGASEVDRAWLTGESRPELVEAGAVVHAGTVNVSSRLIVRAERTGHATRMGQLMERVEEAQSRRAPIVLLADRWSGFFVIAVLVLASLTLLSWWSHGPTQAIEHAVALLIVTCPCALGMATPLAVGAALGRAAQSGLLIKGGDVLERLQKPGRVVFDKTGTLTLGKLVLEDVRGDERYLPWVLAMERQSAHVIARALVSGLEERLSPEQLAEAKRLDGVRARERLGAGLFAEIDGHDVRIGNVQGARCLAEWASQGAEELARHGRTPVLVTVDGEVELLLGLGDPLRPDARETLQRLTDLGYDLAVLSGDHPATVEALVRQTGAPFVLALGGVTPEQKLEYVEQWVKERPVVMVGDGVNDAAALSAASVGVAVHGGAEASLQAADVFATRPGLTPVWRLIDGSRKSLGVVRRNLVFSLVYNLVGATLALAGVLNPLIAALLMPLSSLTVVTSSFRSRSFKT